METVKKTASKYCLVPMCTNTTNNAPNKLFFHVPRIAKLRKHWCKLMRRDNIATTSTLYCCEDHFNVEEDTENYWQYNIMKREGVHVCFRLKKGVVPHRFNCQKQNVPPSKARKGIMKKLRLELLNEVLPDCDMKNNNVLDYTTSAHIEVDDRAEDQSPRALMTEKEEDAKCDRAVQVNIRAAFRSKGVNVDLRKEKKNVALSPISLKSTDIGTSPIKSAVLVKSLFTDDTEESSDYGPDSSSDSSYGEESDDGGFKNLMRSCTLAAIAKEPKMLLGLPKNSYHLIQLLCENVPLSTLDILITLKKIKLNQSFSILGLDFGYAQSTISRIFSKSVPIIAEKMKDLIVWPTPLETYKNLPISFRARYSNVVSIIDCLEIQIEKPSDSVYQALTWSQYKKCNTLKYLISCTPDGLINFISDGYGGRATDVTIVQDSCYLEMLPSNKAVMADRGFKDLSSLLEARKCTLIRPPSVSKSSPSTKEEVKLSKRIAALRIHVERVISRLREFHMLLPHSCVDYKLIPIVDDVIIIVCGLVNMQDVLIKK